MIDWTCEPSYVAVRRILRYNSNKLCDFVLLKCVYDHGDYGVIVKYCVYPNLVNLFQ